MATLPSLPLPKAAVVWSKVAAGRHPWAIEPGFSCFSGLARELESRSETALSTASCEDLAARLAVSGTQTGGAAQAGGLKCG